MEERFRVLKMMSEVTGRMELNAFAKVIGLTPDRVMDDIDELVKAKFLKKTGSGYGITEKGRTILKSYVGVPEGMAFQFYTEIGKPIGATAKTIEEFCQQMRQIPLASVEFHLFRGDFENWVKNSAYDAELAKEFSKLKETKLNGDPLREKLITVIEKKYFLDNQ